MTVENNTSIGKGKYKRVGIDAFCQVCGTNIVVYQCRKVFCKRCRDRIRKAIWRIRNPDKYKQQMLLVNAKEKAKRQIKKVERNSPDNMNLKRLKRLEVQRRKRGKNWQLYRYKARLYYHKHKNKLRKNAKRRYFQRKQTENLFQSLAVKNITTINEITHETNHQ